MIPHNILSSEKTSSLYDIEFETKKKKRCGHIENVFLYVISCFTKADLVNSKLQLRDCAKLGCSNC